MYANKILLELTGFPSLPLFSPSFNSTSVFSVQVVVRLIPIICCCVRNNTRTQWLTILIYSLEVLRKEDSTDCFPLGILHMVNEMAAEAGALEVFLLTCLAPGLRGLDSWELAQHLSVTVALPCGQLGLSHGVVRLIPWQLADHNEHTKGPRHKCKTSSDLALEITQCHC